MFDYNTIILFYFKNSLTKTCVVFSYEKKCWNLNHVTQFVIMMHGSKKWIIVNIHVQNLINN